MTLRTSLMLLLGILLVVAMAVLTLLFQSNLRTYSEATSEQAVHVRTEALGVFLSRSLYEEWQRVERAAARVSGNFNPEQAQATIAGLEQDIDKVSWIGIADRNGTVLAASGNMLVGENVGQRPWFQQGLAGPFAGDVHEAVLLAKLLETNNDDPIRFVDFSAPIKDAQGQVVGVLGAHVNWTWVEGLVQEASSMLQLDAFIINRGGTVILATDPTQGDLSAQPSFRSAQLGVSVTGNETWPDGQTYFTTTVPQFTYQTLPPFGWSMVAKLDPTFVNAAEGRFRTQMLLGTTSTFLLLLAAFAIIAGILLRPLRMLAETLRRLASGEATPFVREQKRFQEVRVLSDAVVLLQAQGSQTGASPHRSGDNPPQ